MVFFKSKSFIVTHMDQWDQFKNQIIMGPQDSQDQETPDPMAGDMDGDGMIQPFLTFCGPTDDPG